MAEEEGDTNLTISIIQKLLGALFTFGPGRGTWAGTEVNTWDTVDQGKGAVFDELGYCRDGDGQGPTMWAGPHLMGHSLVILYSGRNGELTIV